MSYDNSNSSLQLGRLLNLICFCAFFFVIGFVRAETLPSVRYKLAPIATSEQLFYPALDVAKAIREDQAAGKSGPLRYAISHKTQVDIQVSAKSMIGEWVDLPDGLSLWRTQINAKDALSIDLGFNKMYLPQSAQLFLANHKNEIANRVYSDKDNTLSGEFWTPIVVGETAKLEVLVSTEDKRWVQLSLSTVHQAYRDIFSLTHELEKSGTCNVDTICSQGNAFREQIRAVAMYTVGGGACSGQLINNTANDSKRYFITANHCLSTQSDANSVVAYWKYESPSCRVVGSSQNGQVTPLSVAIQQTGGTTLRATHQPSDTTLLEFNSAIANNADPFWDGWDRTETGKSSAIVVHHPQGDEKRISFENNALTTSDVQQQGLPGINHWRVADWDLGTTEQGSSGSGLLSAEKRIIGVLSGGGAACGNNDPDYFGRLGVAWNGGGSSATRVRDWLDPNNSGASTLDGRGACAVPSINLSVPATANAGSQVALAATISGGSGIYPKIEFDLDGDGVFDRVGTQNSINAVYPRTASVNVIARVTDSVGCVATAQRALNIAGPDVVSTASAAQQVCGDNDASIEPGEQWQVPVSLFNAGAQAVNNGQAIFTKVSGSANIAAYQSVTNASNNSLCPFSFVDISNTGQNISFTAAPGSNVFDDAISGVFNLGATNLNFFGTPVNQIRISTNGYISGVNDDGGNYTNACGLAEPVQNGALPRLHVLHDDLFLDADANVKGQYFANCPRAANVGVSNQGCTIVQWTSMQRIIEGTGGNNREGTITFQAILYDQNGEIVYQYRDADPTGGGSASIGLLGTTAGTGFEFSCNAANSAPANRSICLFNNAIANPTVTTPTKFTLTTPSRSLSNLASGQTTNVQVGFHIDTTATCGAPLALRYVGSVDANAASMRGNEILNRTVGESGNCQVFNSCVAPAIANIAPESGLFANPNRFGNGLGHFVIPGAGAVPPTIFGAWFTGEQDRKPTWYVVQGALDFFQANMPILRSNGFACPTCTPALPVQPPLSNVGDAQITYINSSQYVMTWNLNGTAMGEIQSLLYPGANSNPNRTGAWFYPQESGWGVIIDDHILNGAPDQVNVNFIFDNTNTPRWTLGAQGINGGTTAQNTFLVHCPHCPSLPDFVTLPLAVGNQSVFWSGLSNGTFSSTLNFPPPLSGSFNRNSVGLQVLTPIQTQGSTNASELGN